MIPTQKTIELEAQLMEIEKRLWTNDPKTFEEIVLETAILVYPELGPITREMAIKTIEREVADNRMWGDVSFDMVDSIRTTPDTMMITYEVSHRWNYEKSSNQTQASSLYVRRDGSWRLAFHQQTPLPITH